MENITITQAIFLCCLFVFGPAYGFVAVYRHVDSRLGGFWSFLFACFSAYAGWFISGLVAVIKHPEYGSDLKGDITESEAMLYTIPGFVTGWFGLLLLRKISNRNSKKKSAQQAMGCNRR
jgi:UPF0716 family protein affecting phage T7 exclusion